MKQKVASYFSCWHDRFMQCLLFLEAQKQCV